MSRDELGESGKLERKCTYMYCGKVGRKEDTCFKKKAKEGCRQRGTTLISQGILQGV